MAVTAILAAFATAACICALYRRFAPRFGIFDIPGPRGSHVEPTPRGGGIGVYLGLSAGFLVMAPEGRWPPEYVHLMWMAGLLTAVGILDDRRELPVGPRMAVYTLVCFLAVWLVGRPLPLWLFPVAGIYALWVLNLFNFMDGIDGIAAAEAIFVCCTAAALAWWSGDDGSFPLICLLTASACGGFLCFNWAPASLFMGDTGSVPLGFLLAALSLWTGAGEGIPLVCWLILLAVFIGDATLTLIWRGLTGQRVTEAHRLHMYQRLARHWKSHARVVRAVLAYNLLWLAPLALWALGQPRWSPAALLAAYVPIVLVWRKAVKLP